MAGTGAFRSRQLQVVLLVFAVVVAVVAALYVAFFRVEMVPAYENIRESDTSAIAAELAEAEIPYELRNDGHDIYVPEESLSEARVAVAGS